MDHAFPEAPAHLCASGPRSPERLPVAAVCKLTERWWKRKSASAPRDCHGGVQLTLFGQRMAASWLWDARRLLPALVALGAYGDGYSVELQGDPDSLLGLSLAEPVLFEERFLDLAFSGAEALEHGIMRGRRVGPPYGHHLELSSLLAEGGLADLLDSEDPAGGEVLLRVLDWLPDRFLYGSVTHRVPEERRA